MDLRRCVSLSLLLWFGFHRLNPGFQFEERADLIPALNIAYRMGVDGISMPFCCSPPC